MKTLLLCGSLLISLSLTTLLGAERPGPNRTKNDRRLPFLSFRGNGEDGLHLAYSPDGLKWTPLGGDKSFLKPRVGEQAYARPLHLPGAGRHFSSGLDHGLERQGHWNRPFERPGELVGAGVRPGHASRKQKP